MLSFKPVAIKSWYSWPTYLWVSDAWIKQWTSVAHKEYNSYWSELTINDMIYLGSVSQGNRVLLYDFSSLSNICTVVYTDLITRTYSQVCFCKIVVLGVSIKQRVFGPLGNVAHAFCPFCCYNTCVHIKVSEK